MAIVAMGEPTEEYKVGWFAQTLSVPKVSPSRGPCLPFGCQARIQELLLAEKAAPVPVVSC